MFRWFLLCTLLLGWLAAPLHAQGVAGAPLSPRGGVIALPEAQASIDLGEAYDFYGPADTRRILVEMWENPAREAEGVLGLIMPRGSSPQQRGWGAIVTWEDIGYVSSETARDADYDALLGQMQAAVRSGNAGRRADGYTNVQLLGWAQRPEHDSVANTVTWGKEFTFFDGEPNTLHYDLRVLGRNGVLSLNVVGSIEQLPEIRSAAQDLGRRTRFDPGARYADFDAERDEVAGYGIAGLVATGAGVAIAKNVGVWALFAKLLQPLGIALLILAAALATPMRRLFGKKASDARATR
ncbi:DUF2167 domain-containing protein [Erythrobacter sp. EC-HK427]|uniref:DUF2167 domain-containing protein n=1 Tax=Erythrobacter sp. EC-HK427 TaxID=2038396 RepID=UPI001256835B|nr:DUF2167 domain-containing protein [Erythrobacter sp. EC-HK427]VVT16843.1 conserved exported hypothetical protein [Erythrobacter sp. EC-HK427]